MSIIVKNLFSISHDCGGGETILPLLESKNIRIEKILSHGQASPPDFWYDQPANEWVTLLKGTATLIFLDGTITNLLPGDYLQIPRHAKHRVEKTSADALWLAIHHP